MADFTKAGALVLCLCLYLSSAYEFPANEYEYSVRRDWLKEAEATYENRKVVLTEDEEVVDHYLNYLKWREFQDTKISGFPPARPIEEMKEHIEASEVYRVLKKMPKGGNMHTHENHQLSKRTLLDIVYDSEDFQYLHILPEDHPTDPWKIDFFVNPPEGEGWVQVSSDPKYTKETVYDHHNLMSILDEEAMKYPADSGKRWDLMNTLWGKGSSHIIANRNIKIRYVEEMLEHGFEEGVTYLETRKSVGSVYERIYVMDTAPEYAATNGKRYIEMDLPGEYDVVLTMEIAENFSRKHPEFIGHKRISYGQRRQSFADIEETMNKTLALQAKYPNHIKGFDMVGHEDAGNAHLFYLEEFLKMYDSEEKRSKLLFYFHTAETKWSDELMFSDNDKDLVGTMENTYDALLLGTRRVGHGTGYGYHPYLMEILKERGIAIEVCPVSNQILGYYPDLRNHPIITFLRTGGPVVLGSDDAGSFGFEHFNTDWYEAFMAWGLDLIDLKQLALNSLEYSTMTDDEKEDAIKQKFQPFWDKYIETVREEACERNFDDHEPTFARILPRSGAAVGSTKVHIFGRKFERAICSSELACKFGEVSSKARYISNKHIVCQTPERTARNQRKRQNEEVEVSVTFNGREYFQTGETFVYRYDPYTTPATSGGYSGSLPLNGGLIILLSSLLFLSEGY